MGAKCRATLPTIAAHAAREATNVRHPHRVTLASKDPAKCVPTGNPDVGSEHWVARRARAPVCTSWCQDLTADPSRNANASIALRCAARPRPPRLSGSLIDRMLPSMTLGLMERSLPPPIVRSVSRGSDCQAGRKRKGHPKVAFSQKRTTCKGRVKPSRRLVAIFQYDGVPQARYRPGQAPSCPT